MQQGEGELRSGNHIFHMLSCRGVCRRMLKVILDLQLLR